eukprot:3692845-Prymnesium_polylepis.1
MRPLLAALVGVRRLHLQQHSIVSVAACELEISASKPIAFFVPLTLAFGPLDDGCEPPIWRGF